MLSLLSPLHSNPAVQFLHEVEAVRSQKSNIKNFSALFWSDGGNTVHQCSQILHSEVVSVVFPLITQSFQYLSEQIKYKSALAAGFYRLHIWKGHFSETSLNAV